MEFHKKVYAGYKTLAEKYPERIVCINARQTPEEIAKEVIQTLKAKNCL